MSATIKCAICTNLSIPFRVPRTRVRALVYRSTNSLRAQLSGVSAMKVRMIPVMQVPSGTAFRAVREFRKVVLSQACLYE